MRTLLFSSNLTSLTDLLGPLFTTIIGMLLVVGMYWLTVRHFQPQRAQLREATSRHRITTLLLVLYSMISGIGVFIFLDEHNTLLGIFLLIFPLLAGFYDGWWLAESSASRPSTRKIIDHGILVTLLATMLPATLGLTAFAWAAFPSPFDTVTPYGWQAFWVLRASLWTVAYLAFGIVLGVIGAFAGGWFAKRLALRHHGGPPTPSVQP